MAIVTTFRVEGDPDELFRQKQEEIDPISREVAKENGVLQHIVAKTDTGLLIINVWESQEGMEKTSEVVGPQLREKGMTPPSDWQQHELLQHES